jgi:hypothetical protein
MRAGGSSYTPPQAQSSCMSMFVDARALLRLHTAVDSMQQQQTRVH